MSEREVQVLGALHIAVLNALAQFDENSEWRKPGLRLSNTLDAVLTDQPEAI